jgi:signal peptidase I
MPFGFREVRIYRNSMFPTLRDGDRIVYKELKRSPRRGEIVLFRENVLIMCRIKRVVGLPEENIMIAKGVVYINGRPVPYPVKPTMDLAPVRVEPNKYFLLGDNMVESIDSRNFGAVPEKHIILLALFTYWPPSHFRLLNSFHPK